MSDISEVGEKLWSVGKQRIEVIRSLAEKASCSRNAVAKAANKLQLSQRHVYKLIRKYRESYEALTSLIPAKPTGGRGKTRLPEAQEYIIKQVVKDLYLTKQKLNPARIVEEIHNRCFKNSITKPSAMTIRRRLNSLSSEQLKKRQEYDSSIEPVIGSFPEVEYPLSVVQIDHTLVDIILVDPIDRLPIGRPYVTIAIDVYSRCIAGFLLSLEAPSATSVGLCLTHVATKKEIWLSERNIDASWSIHGKPDTIYVDNGSDFHSIALSRGCEQHGIKIKYRPLGKPHYGGIVERVIGTLMKLVHTLPGTTFSNVTERGSYTSDSKACLTLEELEHWFAIAITKYYHIKAHQGIHESPIKRCEAGMLLVEQDKKTFSFIQNRKIFLIDFLPIYHRLLRRDGFVLDHISYYSNVLRTLIRDRKKYGKFLIRRDPRDLSRIYVNLPDGKGYMEIPYRILYNPAISLFEHRIALKRLKNAKKHVQEATLFRAIDEMRHIVKSAKTITRSVRRNRVRLKENKKVQPKKITSSIDFKSKGKNKSTAPFSTIEVWK